MRILVALFGWWWLVVTFTDSTSTWWASKGAFQSIWAAGTGLAACGARCIDSRSTGTKIAVVTGFLANVVSYAMLL